GARGSGGRGSRPGRLRAGTLASPPVATPAARARAGLRRLVQGPGEVSRASWGLHVVVRLQPVGQGGKRGKLQLGCGPVKGPGRGAAGAIGAIDPARLQAGKTRPVDIAPGVVAVVQPLCDGQA